MELILGGTAAVCAAVFTNPLEVVKVRMQLQGELQAKGNYRVHYRNVFHAAWTIIRNENLKAIQKGLSPALCYQFVMNGTRLGLYQMCDQKGLTKNEKGQISVLASMAVSCVCGATSGAIGSPFCLVKTHLQSKANQSIAVGHQHQVESMTKAFKSIYNQYGIVGLWRGMSTTLIRLTVVTAVQLPTFAKSREMITSLNYFEKGSIPNAFLASLVSGLFVSVAMAPIDLVSTRFYNQGVDQVGKGLVYPSVRNCVAQTYKKEGLIGFFKGWTAIYFRLGPHTLLSLVFWDQLQILYGQHKR